MSVAHENARLRWPFRALVRRELITLLRGKRLFWALLALALMASWMVLSRWPGSQDYAWQYLAYRANSLYSSFIMLSMTAAAVVVAAISGSATVSERENDSWDLLRLTLISRLGLVCGKILGPVAIFTLAVGVCAPIFAALLFLAGLDFGRAAQSLALIELTALTCSAIGVACSIASQKTVRAVSATFFFVAVFMGLHVFSIGVLGGIASELLDFPWTQSDWSLLLPFTPYYALYVLSEPVSLDHTTMAIHIAYQTTVLVLAVGYSLHALRRSAESVLPVPRVPRRGRNGTPAETLSHAPMPDGANPIYLRELHWDFPLASGRSRLIAGLVCVLAFCVALFTSVSLLDAGEEAARRYALLIVLVLFGALGCLYVPIACANAYTKEAAISNFDLLRGTLLRPADIVWGKFRAALVLVAVVWLGCTVASAPLIVPELGTAVGREFVGVGIVSLFACLLMASVAGLVVSFYSRRTGAAIAGGIGALFMLYFGNFIFVGLLVEAVSNFSERSMMFALLISGSPVLSYFWNAFDLAAGRDGGHLVEWLLSIAFSVALAYGSQRWLVRKFHGRFEKLAEG